MIEAKVGDTVWIAYAGDVAKTRPCRVCNGNRRVVLLLGTGEQVELDCEMCAKGYEAPTGVEQYWEFEGKPSPFYVTGVEVVENVSGRTVRYRSGTDNGWNSIEAEKCYATFDEAMAASAAVVAEREAEQAQRMGWKEKDTNKSYAWNAGYHLRAAAKDRKSAEYHERKATLLKAKSKEPSNAK